MAHVVRKLIAALIVLRALTNFGKPFKAGSGFVVVGKLMHGVASTVVAPLFGVLMVVYAYGLWRALPFALPLGMGYAIWATLNVVLFPIVEGIPPRFVPWMYALFAVPGIVGPWLAVWLLMTGPANAAEQELARPSEGPSRARLVWMAAIVGCFAGAVYFLFVAPEAVPGVGIVNLQRLVVGAVLAIVGAVLLAGILVKASE